jgi:hypothetical protein
MVAGKTQLSRNPTEARLSRAATTEQYFNVVEVCGGVETAAKTCPILVSSDVRKYTSPCLCDRPHLCFIHKMVCENSHRRTLWRWAGTTQIHCKAKLKMKLETDLSLLDNWYFKECGLPREPIHDFIDIIWLAVDVCGDMLGNDIVIALGVLRYPN